MRQFTCDGSGHFAGSFVVRKFLPFGVARTGTVQMEIIEWHLFKPEQLVVRLVALALEAIPKSRKPCRCTVRCNLRFEYQFEFRHYLPVPFRAALPNAIGECRLCHREPPFKGGSTLGLSVTSA